eukprot:TRINITY_DN424_c0_g1_i1.p1 TRINITY_DN424_c0_g1~~TRINITY_DN424_c0_g1_i1.p1  ORF type:complete len:242 (+),score=62.74 TRINITY_DN424_c0_g1_i1:144-869(+)
MDLKLISTQPISYANDIDVFDYTQPIIRQVPADDNCLFTVFSHCCSGQEFIEVQNLRNICAETFITNPSLYSFAPEYTPAAYYEEIKAYGVTGKKKWGGDIEIMILSEYFKVNVIVIDFSSRTKSPVTTTFKSNPASEGYIFLFFDGTHYNCFAANPVECEEGEWTSPQKDMDICIFSAQNVDKILDEKVLPLAIKKKEKGEFFNPYSVNLMCNSCGMIFDTTKKAERHAEFTGHVNFEQL